MPGLAMGVSLPVQEELSAAQYLELARLAEAEGFGTLFLGEIAGSEVFAMLGVIASHTSRMRLGAGVVSIYTRTPTLTAMGFATLNSIAPGRIIAGLGTGSRLLVEGWHGRELSAPRQMMIDFITILRAELAGERVTEAGAQLHVEGFRLQIPQSGRVPVFMGSFNPAMLRLAGAIADGVVLAFCPPAGLAERIAHIHQGARDAGRDPGEIEIAAYVNCYAGDQVELAMERFRRLVLQYAVQPTHRAGFVDVFPGIDRATQLWNAGDRAAALTLVPDETVLALCPVGDAALVVEHIERVRAAGVDLPVVFPQSLRPGDSESPATTIRRVAEQVGTARLRQESTA